MSEGIPRVVIVGGGFGGLAAAKALRHAPAQIILIDRANHHLFQPLLYQVATSVLLSRRHRFSDPRDFQGSEEHDGDSGRRSRESKRIGSVHFGQATQIEKAVPISFDYLILGNGSESQLFRARRICTVRAGLKALADAVAIRNKMLQAFEQAEAEEDPGRHRELSDIYLDWGGPTGVEMASAIAFSSADAANRSFDGLILSRRGLFWLIRPIACWEVFRRTVRGGEGATGTAGGGSAARTRRRSDRRRRHRDSWGAHQEQDRDLDCGRGSFSPQENGCMWTRIVPVGCVSEKNLSVPGHSEIFVIGDTASLDQGGKPLPGVAQVAIQQGRYAGKLIHSRESPGPTPREIPFRYSRQREPGCRGQGLRRDAKRQGPLSGFLAWIDMGVRTSRISRASQSAE